MNTPNFKPRMPAVDVWDDSVMAKVFESARHLPTPGVVVVTPGHQNKLVLGLPADDLYLAKKKRNSKYAEVIEQFSALSKPQNISAIAMTDVATGFEDVRHPDDLPYTGAQAIPFIWDLFILGTLGHRVLIFEGHSSVLKMGCRDTDVLIVDEEMVPFLQSNWASVAYSVMRGGRKILIFQRGGGVRQLTNISPDSDETENLLQRGIEKFEREDYRNAIADFRQAIALDPNFSQAYSAWGNTCFAMQDYQSAIVCFEQAIRFDPSLADAYGGRGLAYYQTGDKQRALDDFTRSIEINPTLPQAYYSRGELSLELSNIPQALTDFEQAIDLYLSVEGSSLENPHNESALHRIQNHYRSGITYRHSTAESLIKRARAAIQEKRFQQALVHLAKGIQLEPDLAELYYDRSAAYWSLGQIQEALDSVSHAIHLNSRSANFYNDRGHIYFQQINQACIPDFKQAIKLDPYLVSAYFNLGVVYAGLGNKQDALYYFQHAATLFQQQGDRQGHEQAIQAISQVNHSL